MFQQYMSELNGLMTEFGKNLAPGYAQHLQKQFMTAPIVQIQQKMDDLPEDLRIQRAQYITDAQVAQSKKEWEDKALKTANDTYYLADSTYQRVVCSSKSPGFEKTGMPAYDDDLGNYDPELKGYSGVHVGNPEEWLPVLARDGYCDANAYIYNIYAEEMADTETPLYVMDDYHVMDRTSTPDSQIIFSRLQVLPASIIELKKTIPARKIKPARDLY